VAAPGGNSTARSSAGLELTKAAAAAGGTGSACPVPGWVAARTSLDTCAGWSTARAWAIMPPIDQPSTATRPSRSAEISALVWFAMAVMLTGEGSPAVWPTPALSSATTW
jgi:hypothetical protein